MRCIYYTVFEICDSHVGEERSSSHYSGKLWSLPDGTYLFQVLGSSLRIPCQALPVHKPLRQTLDRHAFLKAMRKYLNKNSLHVTNIFHSRPPCDKPLVCSHSKAGQNKPVLTKRTCKRVRYSTSIIWFYIHLDFPSLHPEQQTKNKCFLQWVLCYQQELDHIGCSELTLL